MQFLDPNQMVIQKRVSAPSIPISGEYVLYAQRDGILYGINDSGVETQLSQTSPIQDNGGSIDVPNAQRLVLPYKILDTHSTPATTIIRYLPIPTATTMWYGIVAADESIIQIGQNEGVTTAGSTSFIETTNSNYYRITSTAVANNVAAARLLHAHSNFLPDLTIKFRTSANATLMRYMIGFITSASYNTSADNLGNGVNAVYFRYSTSAPDAGWVGIAHTSSTNRTLTSSLAQFYPDTEYRLRVRYVTSTDVRFSVDGGTETSISTAASIPSNADMYAFGSVCTFVGVTQNIDIAGASLSF